MIYFDLDGVIRNLCGIDRGNWQRWDDRIDGKTVVDYVNSDLSLLYQAPTTEYYPVICELQRINIITCQPESWRPYTMAWISIHNERGNISVQFVSHADEKLALLNEGDLLVEDYPLFEDYSKIVLIDYPYNQNVKGEVARIKTPDELRRFLA